MNELTPFESEVMAKLLSGDDPVLATLREQLATATVSDREYTGAGFYTYFHIPEEKERVCEADSFQFGDVCAEIQGLKHGAGFLLFVRDGYIDCLEGYSFNEPWPTDIGHFSVRYVGGKRNLESLRLSWEKS